MKLTPEEIATSQQLQQDAIAIGAEIHNTLPPGTHFLVVLGRASSQVCIALTSFPRERIPEILQQTADSLA